LEKNLDNEERNNENRFTLIMGLSTSSAIIGNTVFGKGNFRDIKNEFILDKKILSLLLIDSSVWMYTLKGTEDIELIESSEDIIATLKKEPI
jgi:hypothetical protein